MRWRWLMAATVLAALSLLVAQPQATFSVRITEKTTLGEILSALARRTTAQLKMDEQTRNFVHRYTFPPHMIGVTVCTTFDFDRERAVAARKLLPSTDRHKSPAA